MMRFCFGILFFLFTCRISWAHIDPVVSDWNSRDLPTIQLPSVQRWKSPDGPEVYYLPNPTLPVVKMSVLIPVGDLHDSFEKKGLHPFWTNALERAGTQQYSPQEWSQKLETKAIRIQVSSMPKYTVVSLRCLSEDFEEGLQLLQQMLLHPRFDSDEVEIIRQQHLKAISQRNDRVERLAQREFNKFLYGQNDPRAYYSRPESIQAITHDDLKEWTKRVIAKNRMYVAMSTQIEENEWKKKLSDFFSRLPVLADPLALPEYTNQPIESVIGFVERDLPQSTLQMGHWGATWNDPRKNAMELASYVLVSGALVSRMGMRLRSELGLTYGARGGFSFSEDGGQFSVMVSTKSASTGQVFSEMKKVLNEILVHRPITKDELESARRQLLFRYLHDFENPFDLAWTQLVGEWQGRPRDFLQRDIHEIRHLNQEQVQRALVEMIHPDRLKWIVVGERSVRSQLKSDLPIQNLPLKLY